MSSTVFKSIKGSKLFVTNNVNQIVFGTTNTVTISSTAPSASRTYTIPDTGANSSFIMSDLAQTINGVKTFSSGAVINTTTNQLTLGSTNTTTISAVAPSSSRVYSIQDAGANADFVMTAGNQTVGGLKTFNSLIQVSATTNQIRLGDATNITLTAPAPASSITYTIPDTGANSSFVMTDLAQTIGGIKTFGAGTTIFRAPAATNSILQMNGNNTDPSTTGYQLYVPSANNRITLASKSTGSDLMDFSDTGVNIKKVMDITNSSANLRTWIQNTAVATGGGTANIGRISFSATMTMIAKVKVYSIDSGGNTTIFISTYEIKNNAGTVTYSLLFTDADYDQTITPSVSASIFYLTITRSGSLTKNVVTHINVLNVSSGSFSIPDIVT